MATYSRGNGYTSRILARDHFEDTERAKECTMRYMTESDKGHLHLSRRGEIPIYKMENERLINILKMVSKNLAEDIGSSTSFTSPVSLMDAIMEGPDYVKRKSSDVKEIVSNTYIALGRYAFEAMRRGLHFEAMGAMSPIINAMNDLLTIRPDGTPVPQIPSNKIDENDPVGNVNG